MDKHYRANYYKEKRENISMSRTASESVRIADSKVIERIGGKQSLLSIIVHKIFFK